MEFLKTKRTFSSLDRLNALLRRWYPLPEAFIGYLFGILTALCSLDGLTALYRPLPLKEALPEALTAELPFWFAAALLALIRPVVAGGRLLVFLKAATCGHGALMLLSGSYPSFDYFRYVALSLLITALYLCLIRQAADLFDNRSRSDQGMAWQSVCDYLIRSLFYFGSALLLLPLKYFTGF